MFVNWGLEVAINPGYWKQTALGNESADGDKVLTKWLHICAICHTPFIMDENHMYDISDIVPSEDVTAALNAIGKLKPGPKTKVIDP